MVTKCLEKLAIIMLKKHRKFCRCGLTHLDATPIFEKSFRSFWVTLYMKLYFFYSRSSHWLVVPKPGWPQASRTGLSMKFLESDKFGNQHFTFDHSASYQTIQKRFFHAVDSFNPEFIIVRVWFQLNPPTKILTSYAFVTRIPTGELLSVPFTFQIFWKIG